MIGEKTCLELPIVWNYPDIPPLPEGAGNSRVFVTVTYHTCSIADSLYILVHFYTLILNQLKLVNVNYKITSTLFDQQFIFLLHNAIIQYITIFNKSYTPGISVIWKNMMYTYVSSIY